MNMIFKKVILIMIVVPDSGVNNFFLAEDGAPASVSDKVGIRIVRSDF